LNICNDSLYTILENKDQFVKINRKVVLFLLISKVTDGILKLKLNEKNISNINFTIDVSDGDIIYLEYGLSCKMDDKRINNDYDLQLNILSSQCEFYNKAKIPAAVMFMKCKSLLIGRQI